MKENRIFVNTIAFVEELRAGKLQQEFMQPVREAGFKGIEVRREFIRDFAAEGQEMQRLSQELGLELYYSVPDWLYRDGVCQLERTEQYIREAGLLKAKMLKLSVGEFPGTMGDELILLRNVINGFQGIVTIENDQTAQSGNLSVNLGFLQMCRENGIRVYSTFDLGNWYWVHEDPWKAAAVLRTFTYSLHLKNVVLEQGGPRVAGLDEGLIDWRNLMRGFPEEIRIGLEYPCGPKAMEVLRRDLALVQAL